MNFNLFNSQLVQIYGEVTRKLHFSEYFINRCQTDPNVRRNFDHETTVLRFLVNIYCWMFYQFCFPRVNSPVKIAQDSAFTTTKKGHNRLVNPATEFFFFNALISI